MYPVSPDDPSEEFLSALRAAHEHIGRQAQGGFSGWLYSCERGPSLHHLAFRLGNQLFFGRLAINGRDDGPADPGALIAYAHRARAHAFYMPLQKRPQGWEPEAPGWGLVDAQSGAPLDPLAEVDDRLIEMSDIELQDFAVQIVVNQLRAQGWSMTGIQTNPEVDPAIWCADQDGVAFVVVRAARYPALEPSSPANRADIKKRCDPAGRGYYAAVGVASADDAFDPEGRIPATPLWRGHGMVVRFGGVEPL